MHVGILLLSVGLEIATLYTMFAMSTRPDYMAAPLGLAARSACAVIDAIYLGLARPRGVTHRDFEHVLQKRVGTALLYAMDRSVQGDSTDPSGSGLQSEDKGKPAL